MELPFVAAFARAFCQMDSLAAKDRRKMNEWKNHARPPGRGAECLQSQKDQCVSAPVDVEEIEVIRIWDRVCLELAVVCSHAWPPSR